MGRLAMARWYSRSESCQPNVQIGQQKMGGRSLQAVDTCQNSGQRVTRCMCVVIVVMNCKKHVCQFKIAYAHNLHICYINCRIASERGVSIMDDFVESVLLLGSLKAEQACRSHLLVVATPASHPNRWLCVRLPFFYCIATTICSLDVWLPH